MLHRSFKPAKCKTALKLAVSRIKVLNNKREVQVRQIKRELAQLLESGQVQTARIRVEHVVREEKTLTAYNLIEIYCELIATRLPIIESQKNCPIDLKEAITSVIFATPRCVDVPELSEIKKHFTGKYGKEFITAAIELRPDCGVNRMLVEKLSAKAPDGQTKLRILTEIAEEHNVKWNPDSFSESDPKPPQDLLNGPNAFEMASKIHTEDPPGPARPNQDSRGGTPNFQVPPKLNEKGDVSVNFNAQNTRPSSGSQSFASTGVGPDIATSSGAFHPEERSSEIGTEWMERKQSFPRNENPSSLGGQDWSMQFKDATSAAQAAAESAERASMAARAAAELSRQHSLESRKSYGYSPKDEAPQIYTGSKLQSDVPKDGENNAFHQRNSGRHDGHIVDKGQEERQHSSESQKSYGYAPKDEAPQTYAGSKSQNDLVSKDAENNAFHPRNSGGPDRHTGDKGREELAGPAERLVREGHNNNVRYGKEASLKSSRVSAQGATSVNSFQRVDTNSQRRSSKSFESDYVDQVSKKTHSGESELKSVVDIQDSMQSEEIAYFDEKVTRKQPSSVSRHSHSSSFSDDQEEILRKNDDITYFEDVKTEKQPSRASSRTHSSNSGDIHEDIFRNDQSEDPFARDYSSIYGHISETNSKESTAVFDNYSSDDDNYKVDLLDHKGQETSASTGRKSSINLFTDSAVWSPTKHTDEELGKFASQSHPSVFSETSEVSNFPSRPDDLPPAAFDDYDSPSSDGEEDLGKSKLTGSTDLHEVPSEKSVHSRSSDLVQNDSDVSEDEIIVSRRNPLSRPSTVDPQPEQVLSDRRSQGITSKPESEKIFDDLPTRQPHSWRMKSRLESTVKEETELADTAKNSEFLDEFTSASGKELNFGALTGGRRNKVNAHPPYLRKSSVNAFPGKEATEDSHSDIEQSSSDSPRVRSLNSSSASQEKYNEGVSTKPNNKTNFGTLGKQEDSAYNHSDKEPRQETSIRKQLYNQKSSSDQNKKSSSRASHTYFDSDSSDTEEDVSELTAPINARPGAGLSRRTKLSSFHNGRANAKTIVSSEEAVTFNYRAESKSSSNSSHISETLPKPSGRTYSKNPVSSEEAVTPNRKAESKSSSRSSQVAETLSVSVDRPYSKNTVSSEEYLAPNYGIESKSSSSSSSVGETLPKTSGRAYSKTTVPSREPVTPSYRAGSKSSSSSSHVGETSPKSFSETKSLLQGEIRERHRLGQQDSTKPVPESRRSSLTDSSKSSTTEQKPRIPPKSVKPEVTEASNSGETSPKSFLETKSLLQGGIRERHRLGQQDSTKIVPESRRSSLTDSSKSSTTEQKPRIPPKSVKPEVTEASNSPAVTRELSSKDKSSHVHPKLPDSDAFTAFFHSLKQTRE